MYINEVVECVYLTVIIAKTRRLFHLFLCIDEKVNKIRVFITSNLKGFFTFAQDLKNPIFSNIENGRVAQLDRASAF